MRVSGIDSGFDMEMNPDADSRTFGGLVLGNAYENRNLLERAKEANRRINTLYRTGRVGGVLRGAL